MLHDAPDPLAVRPSTSLINPAFELVAKIQWSFVEALVTDWRKFNPFFNAWCDFVFPPKR